MKRTLVIILVFALIVTVGCKKNRKTIPREEMISVLVKVHLMDGALEVSQYNPEITVPDTLDAYEVVLEDYGYTRAQFDSSLQYYAKDLRRFDRMYQEVLTRLNQMETEAQERSQDSGRRKGEEIPEKRDRQTPSDE